MVYMTLGERTLPHQRLYIMSRALFHVCIVITASVYPLLVHVFYMYRHNRNSTCVYTLLQLRTTPCHIHAHTCAHVPCIYTCTI